MMTTPRITAAASCAGQSRQLDLQALLHGHQREMQQVLQRRVSDAPSEGRTDGLDEIEQAEVDVQQDIEVALVQMKGDTLRRVREALTRLDEGAYGSCADCGAEITEKRLHALPFAVRCAPCEKAHEQRAARERRFGLAQGFRLTAADQSGL